MKADLSVDEKKTTALRAKMAKQRGKVKMFDRGGEIAELKKRCKKETGLEPPRQPEFQAWALKFLEQQPKAKGRIKMARG
jgi:N-methylhydantoinase B